MSGIEVTEHATPRCRVCGRPQGFLHLGTCSEFNPVDERSRSMGGYIVMHYCCDPLTTDVVKAPVIHDVVDFVEEKRARFASVDVTGLEFNEVGLVHQLAAALRRAKG